MTKDAEKEKLALAKLEREEQVQINKGFCISRSQMKLNNNRINQ